MLPNMRTAPVGSSAPGMSAHRGVGCFGFQPRAAASSHPGCYKGLHQPPPDTWTWRLTHVAQHTTHNTQHTTPNTQHTTHNTQHTTHNTQHTTHNTQHTPHTTQHTAHSTQHTAHTTQHTAHSTQHTAHTHTHTICMYVYIYIYQIYKHKQISQVKKRVLDRSMHACLNPGPEDQ